MQALSLLPLKGNCLTVVTHFQFEVGSSRTRRREERVFDKPFSQFLFVSNNLKESQCGVFSNDSKLNYGFLCEPKRNSFGASFALALALEKEAIGNSEDGFSEKSDCISVDEVKGGKKIVSKEKEEKFEKRSELDDMSNSTRIDVRAVVMSLQSAKTADDVEDVVKDVGELPLKACSTMIRRFGTDKKLDPAMAILEWLKRKKEKGGSIGPNLFIYNSLLGAVKDAGKCGDAEKIMKEMNEVGVVPNIVTYNTLMGIHLEQGQPTKALNVLEEIQKKGISPSAASYSTALTAYRRMEDGDGALKFFVEVRDKYQKGEIKSDYYDEDWDVEIVKLENYINRICYQVMRQWLVKGDPLTTDALRLLMDMDNAGVKPSLVEQERLIWACTLEGHYIVAKELYTRIRERESQISLSICNHVIWLMGKAKKWWAALEVYEDMLAIGPKPNNLSQELITSHFNILLTAAQKKGIWRWGVRLLNKMEEKGLKPGSKEWNAVLAACSKASETTAAVQVFHRMVENGIKPDIVSYGALLSALEKGGLCDEALRVWEHMVKVGIKPNLYAYTILASVHSGQGKSEMVESVIQEMVKAGVEPTVVTFNAIISGCARNGKGSTAFEWFNRMKEWDLTPNSITYEMLIDALTRDAKPILAYEMYLKAQSEELELSSKAYDAVIRSASVYGATIDERILGPRPLEKNNRLNIRKNLTEFCDLADVPRRSKPFEKHELQAPQTRGNGL